MKVRYFAQTDTLFIELSAAAAAVTRELDEDTLLELNAGGQVCAITVEHASRRADAPHFTYQQIPA